MMRRLLPHPVQTLIIILLWMLLANQFAWGSLVFAIILGIAIPACVSAYWADRPKIKSPVKLAIYLLIVVYDIVKANIDVAKIVVFTPRRDLRPAWIVIPLEIQVPEAITLLAATITLTPGTVSADLSEDGSALLVHCLHAPDPQAVIDDIKTRYEGALKEIFA